MNEFEKKFSVAPANSNRFATEQDPKRMFADPADQSTTGEAGGDVRPVRLTAFTGQPMKHWWYGACIFDRDGFRASSEQITIDYDHNPSEELGYLDRFSGNPELICEGALIPFGQDRAAQIIHKAKNGRKYQCSVTVDEYLRTEYLEEGMTAQVNGQTVQGPITIFREYSIMGVAITPYATDKGTDTEIFKHKEPNNMATDDKTKEPIKTDNSRELFKKFNKLFGPVKAAKYFADDLTEDEAKDKYTEEVQEEVAQLEAEIKEKDEKIADLESQLSDKSATDDGETETEKEYAAKIQKLESENTQLRTAAGVFKSEPTPVSGNNPQTPEPKKAFSPLGEGNAAYAAKIKSQIRSQEA